MKLAFLGSIGFLGEVFAKRLLEEGYEVKTLIRTPDKLDEIKNKVEFVQGNYFNRDDPEKTVTGMEAVLSSVGSPQRNPQFPEKLETAMKDLTDFMLEQVSSNKLITKALLVANK